MIDVEMLNGGNTKIVWDDAAAYTAEMEPTVAAAALPR